MSFTATETSICHYPAAAFCWLRPFCRAFVLPLVDMHACPVLGWRAHLQSKQHPMMVATVLQRERAKPIHANCNEMVETKAG
jgi:hypothetical protein